MILHEINNHRFASVFQNPIREQDAPGYYDIVKQPMDLKSLKKRLREGVIFIRYIFLGIYYKKVKRNFVLDHPRYQFISS